MRFKIIIQPQGKEVIPFNYQYEISSWIYKLINQSDNELGKWLHDSGYTNGDSKQFKLFTFSNFRINKFEHHNDRMRILSDEISLTVSFLPEKIPLAFISGLFTNQQFTIGDKYGRGNFQVKTVVNIPEPVFTETMFFKCISPILVTENQSEKRHAQYLSPEHPKYAELLKNNLKSKLAAYRTNNNDTKTTETDFDFDFQLQEKPKSRLITIKAHTQQETKLKAFIYKFSLTAPPEIMHLGYYAGFGEKNALGFGCVEVCDKR